jgi:AcrR family transcriptional regulator
MRCINATDILTPMHELDGDVVSAAARILDRNGLRGLTISALAEEAGISRVTLHRRGASLDDYIVAVLGRASDDLRTSLWPVLTGAGTALERLETSLRVLCEVCERHAGVMMALFGVPARPLPAQPGRTTSVEFIEPFERLVRDGVLEGSLVSDDPLGDAVLTANAVCWTYLHMRHAHRWSVSDATDRVVGLGLARLRFGEPR